MMQQQKEYKILPQIESEDYYRNRREDEFDEYEMKKPVCFYCVIALITLLVFGACATLITGTIWSKEFNQNLSKFWPYGNWSKWNTTIPDTLSTAIHTTTEPSNITLATGNSSEETGSWNITSPQPGSVKVKNGTVTDVDEINERNVGEKFSQAMRQFEKEMERLSGIHQAELVIPLFMLILFMSLLALISLCCCIMSKQREKRQRKLLGKFITDLQTGDQRTVLLNKDEDF